MGGGGGPPAVTSDIITNARSGSHTPHIRFLSLAGVRVAGWSFFDRLRTMAPEGSRCLGGFLEFFDHFFQHRLEKDCRGKEKTQFCLKFAMFKLFKVLRLFFWRTRGGGGLGLCSWGPAAPPLPSLSPPV